MKNHRNPDTEEDSTLVRINLPLPMSVTGHIIRAFGQLWPDGAIVTGDRYRYDNQMVFRLPDKLPEDPPVAMEPAEIDGEVEAWVEAFMPGGILLSPPEKMAAWLCQHAWDALHANPEAVNYLQMGVIDEKTGKQLNVLILNPDGKPPHELRQEALDRVTRLEAQLREAGIEPVE